MSTEIEEYRFYFKVPYTETAFWIRFSPEDTISDLMAEVIDELQERNLFRHENDVFELVEAGQYNNINGRDPELAPFIVHPFSSTLREIYGNKWKQTAFYARIKHYNE